MHCKELLDFLCVTARGSALERASLCFTICDVQGRGAITRTDLLVVLGSIADLVGVNSLRETEEVLDRIFPRWREFPRCRMFSVCPQNRIFYPIPCSLVEDLHIYKHNLFYLFIHCFCFAKCTLERTFITLSHTLHQSDPRIKLLLNLSSEKLEFDSLCKKYWRLM